MNAVHDYLVRSRDTIQAALDDPAFAIAIAEIVEAIADALGNAANFCLPAMAAVRPMPSI